MGGDGSPPRGLFIRRSAFDVQRSTFLLLFALISKMLTAIIVAGGSSSRMGFDKTFAILGDRPVVAHTLAAFEAATCVDEMVVVGREERLEELREVITRFGFLKVQHVIAGGVHRQDSVSAGLEKSPSADYVAVHDAARPLVTANEIAQVFAAAREHQAAALAAPMTDTLKRGDVNHLVTASIDRDGIYAMQTPQIFARELLAKAYQAVAAAKIAITDEVSAIQHLGHRVVLVPNDDFNFKITFPRDLSLAEFVLRERSAAGETAVAP